MRIGCLIKEIFPITGTGPRTALSRPRWQKSMFVRRPRGCGADLALAASCRPDRQAGRHRPPALSSRRSCPPARPHARTPARTNARSPRGSAEEFAEQILEFMTCAQYSGRRSTTARRMCLRSLHSIAYFPHGTEACVGGTAWAAQWRARPAYIYDNKQPMGVRAGVTRKAVAQ